MRFSNNNHNQNDDDDDDESSGSRTVLQIDEDETTPPTNSTLECHTRWPEHPLKKTSPAEYIYTEIVKAIGGNDFIEERRLLKRASWSPSVHQEHRLPPSGKRNDFEQSTTKNGHRVRLRPKTSRYFVQSQPPQTSSLVRPLSFNERYDRHLIEHPQRLSNQSLAHNGHFSIQNLDPSRSPSSSSADTIVQGTTRTSPPLDGSDFISDTSTCSSVTTANTITSLASSIPSVSFRRPSPVFERVYSRSPLSEYQQQQQQPSSRIDYKFVSPVHTNPTVPMSSPISSSSSSSASFTCPKGHEQLSSSPMGSSLNQYVEFASQTRPTAGNNGEAVHDGDDIGLATTTTRRLMTVSTSPNRHHNQTRTATAIIKSAQISPTVTIITTNNSEGLKQQQQQRDQTDSMTVTHGGCMKSSTNIPRRLKKSVHFDRHLSTEIRSTSSPPVKATWSNYRPVVSVASSSLSNGGSDDEQKKQQHDDDDGGGGSRATAKERERIETTTRRTIIVAPLTTNTLRSFSSSPSPSSSLLPTNDESNRRHREEKKENVDEPNCTTMSSSRRVTTAATHLHCTTSTVTFNDGSSSNGSSNVAQTKEPNGTTLARNDGDTRHSLLKRQISSSAVDHSMPLNNLLVKTSSLNTIASAPSSASSARKLIGGVGSGLLGLITRSNSNNKSLSSSTTTDESKQLRRTLSAQLRAQRKTKQQIPNGSKRLSADVEFLLPPPPPPPPPASSSSVNNNSIDESKGEFHVFDKVTTHERQSPVAVVCTSNADPSSVPPLCNNSVSMPLTITKSDDTTDSLNNGLLFRPVTETINDPKSDYVLHNHQVLTTQREPFFLSPSVPLSIGDESSSVPINGIMTQTSTLIISTPPQYHYYLYPPTSTNHTLSSSASSSLSSSSSAKNPKVVAATNRTVSNVSINSVSTNSSSSNTSFPSYESQGHDTDLHQSSHSAMIAEDETPPSSSYSTTNTNQQKTRQKKVVHSALIDWKLKNETSNDSSTTKPVVLSDSVQAFWPPPPSPSSLNITSDPPATASAVELNKRDSISRNHRHKQLDPSTTTTTIHSNGTSIIGSTTTTPLSTYLDESLSINNSSQSSALPPPPPSSLSSLSPLATAISVNHNREEVEEVRSYSEQRSFSNDCLRIATDTPLEDTQASYTERLREKSRSITTNRPMAMNGNSGSEMYLFNQNHYHHGNYYLPRSMSKDALNEAHTRTIPIVNQFQNAHLAITEFPASSILPNETTIYTHRPKSAGQQPPPQFPPPPPRIVARTQPLLSPVRLDNSKLQKTVVQVNHDPQSITPERAVNDFQLKRQFFENRTYTDYSPSPSSTPIQTIPNSNSISPISTSSSTSSSRSNGSLLQQTTLNNGHHQRNVTRRSWNDLSSRSTTAAPAPSPPPPPPPPDVMRPAPTFFDASVHHASLPPTVLRKPVRIVKAVQRSAPQSTNESSLSSSPPSTSSSSSRTSGTTNDLLTSANRPIPTSKTYSLAKPGLFSASPIISSQHAPASPPHRKTNYMHSSSDPTTNTIEPIGKPPSPARTRRFKSRDENELETNLKEFALRYPNNRQLSELARLSLADEHHLSTDYTRALFPIPDRLRRIRSRQSSGGDSSVNSTIDLSDSTHRTVFSDSNIFDANSTQQAEDLITNLKKRHESLRENQRTISEEIETNNLLGNKLLKVIETSAESHEVEKFKLHIGEIDTITSILLKLSSRLAKVENDLLMLSNNADTNDHTKASLIDRREKAQQKHDEAKFLKDGIDRRSRVVTNILRKYLSDEQFDDYDHFIRMKSTLLMDAKDVEESIALVQRQMQLLLSVPSSSSSLINRYPYHQSRSFDYVASPSPASLSTFESFTTSNSTTSSSSNTVDGLQTSYLKAISSTA